MNLGLGQRFVCTFQWHSIPLLEQPLLQKVGTKQTILRGMGMGIAVFYSQSAG
jgi:hypothetical protein